MPTQKIRLMIVDDSIFFREFMSRSLSVNPSIEVVGMASDAIEAQQKIETLNPDVIALDMEMPKMRGTDFLRTVRPKYPRIQIVVISSNPNNVFEALQAGAVDFVSKPNTQLKIDNATFIREAANKIRIAAFGTRTSVAAKTPPKTAPALNVPKVPIPTTISVRNPKTVVAIGASTGGTEAILEVIRDLPENSPGILIVQHMPPTFTKMYAERLDKTCRIAVKEAQNGDRVKPGLALLAAGDKHLRLRVDGSGYYVSCDAGEKVSGHCPSVDVLFESMAQYAGPNAIGVILTGMGSDGAKGMVAMKHKGAYTIGQDQASCVVYGMPMMAYNMGGVTEQLPLSRITGAIVRQLTK